jgi:hypothetical protein
LFFIKIWKEIPFHVYNIMRGDYPRLVV